MTFVSFEFLVFIAVFTVLYILTRGRARLAVILISSCVFYGWFNPWFLLLIWFSILLDFTTSQIIDRSNSEGVRRLALTGTIVCNLGVLAFFKYWNFLIDQLNNVLPFFGTTTPVDRWNIFLPIGVSFYTFQSMSYAIDVYRRDMPAERSLLRYAAFVTFFPQLVAGPIVRAESFMPQMQREQQVTWNSLLSGLQLIVWGYFMKVVVADSLAVYVDQHFAAPQFASSLSLFIAVIFYAFQIYGDFFGYSLIAIGIGEVFGFDLGRNFDRPYFSASFSEFWQRWHISLSTWLRDYLYIPLGGNRHGTFMTYRNLFLTMLLGGLWHGASWNFVIWGCLHGFYLIGQRLVGNRFYGLVQNAGVPAFATRLVCVPVVFALTCLAWIFFRAQTLDQSLLIIQKITRYDGLGFGSVPLKFDVAKGVALILLVVICESLSFRVALRDYLKDHPFRMVLAGAMLVWLIALVGTFSGSAFIYFQF
jgi:D-alanyl-lipoteichoic acid acyltransferase DltB (MBOAT superfamily)